MTIVIIDKYPILRLGLINFLREHFQRLNANVVELDNFKALVLGAPIKDVDLIILGVGQASISSYVKLVGSVKKLYMRAKLIAYDEGSEPAQVPYYFRAGLQGYISKQEELQKLIDCIDKVMNHQKYISEEIIDLTLDLDLNTVKSANRANMPLSPRENQVARFLCKVMSTSAIAEALDRKASTISTIKFNIFQKMRVDNVIKLREQFARRNQKWRR